MSKIGAYKSTAVGAELYIKSSEGYTKIDEIENDYVLLYELNPGESNVYVVRVYVLKDNVRLYSDYSNELLIENNNIIIYDLDGGVNSIKNPIGYSSNSQSEIILESPTKEGYKFIGWTGSNGDIPEIEVIIERGTTGVLNYKANWELIVD